jgi:hypothetical protein
MDNNKMGGGSLRGSSDNPQQLKATPTPTVTPTTPISHPPLNSHTNTHTRSSGGFGDGQETPGGVLNNITGMFCLCVCVCV